MRKKISIVTPCYNEEASIEDCHAAIKRLFATELADYDYEHIFADNASQDSTVAKLKALAAADSHTKLIVNSRNFGPFRSMFNAILSATGDAVVTFFPVDMQDPPEVIPQFVRHWEEGYKVVYGIRSKRTESRIMAFIRRRYYRMVSRLAEIQIPNDVGEFQLVDRIVIEALRRHDDYYPYVRGMIANCGFRSTGVAYTWKARERGVTSNNLYRLIDQGLNGLISFSNVPLRICMLAGLALSGLSILYAFINLIIGLLYYRELAQPGIVTLIVALFFFSGVQLFFLGVLGEYISAIHHQVRKRPLVIEAERINFD